MLRWTLIPALTGDPAIGHSLINARSEAAAEKPSFRAAWRRCLDPAKCFLEWRHRGGTRQPSLFGPRDGAPSAVASRSERIAFSSCRQAHRLPHPDRRAERKHVQNDSPRRRDRLAGLIRRPPSGHRGAQGVQGGVAGLLRHRRAVTSADRKATRNALTDRGPVGSLNRHEGSKSLPVARLRTIAKAKVDSCLTARRAGALSHRHADRTVHLAHRQ